MFLDNKNRSGFEKVILCNGFTPTISVATHSKPNAQLTCIDNILVSNIEHVTGSGVLETHISHHRSPYLTYKLSCETQKTHQANKPKTSIKYDFSKENLNSLSKNLCTKLNYTGRHQDFSDFINIFSSCIEECCKLKTTKVSKRNRIKNPWITSALINSIAKRDRLYKNWKKSTSKLCKSGDPRLYEEYRTYRNKLSNIIKYAKQNHYARTFQNSSGNLKQTWAIIHELRGKVKTPLSSFFTFGNTTVTDKKQIANKFNTYFNSIAEDLNKNILDDHSTQTSNFTNCLQKPEEGSIFLEDTTPDEVLDIIKEFDNNKSSDIPIVVIKHCAQIIAPTLSKLYNSCMSRGTFPDELKLGVITPIHKKGPKDDVGSYRPISTLPIFGKIFEKILYSRIYNFMSQYKIICDTQFGFRQNHSTSHAIHHSINFIKESHMLNKHVIGIFIDLSKAFDTTDHKTLLYKLYNYGIRGLAYNLIKSYLSNRYQCVKIEDEKSENVLVKYGVPQGSVLGPLLFLLFINDLKNTITHKNCKIILYADDTNIFIACDTISNATQLSNEVLVRIQSYMYSNLLHINIDKS